MIVTHTQQPLTKFSSEIGMGNGSQQGAPFAQTFPMQITRTVFRRHPMNVSARRDHSGTGSEFGHESRHR